MKIKLFLIFLLFIFSKKINSQPIGQWTWMNGSNQLDFAGNFAVRGSPSPLSKPPSIYEGVEWTDNDGNFWIYGGESSTAFLNDMWKYDVNTNMWTWVSGSGGISDQRPFYGIKGVASSLNTPGERLESMSWKDSHGNFWLFGGVGYYDIGGGSDYNDLWMYNITTNLWTWMKGDSLDRYRNVGDAVYGSQGIENASSKPGFMEEIDITWVDDDDNLWMVDWKGCLWRYRVQTNNWTWMKGDTTGKTIYGPKGIPSPSTTPGLSFFAYTRWKDSKGFFWYYFYEDFVPVNKVLFKYDISTNLWTRVWGDTNGIYNSRYGEFLCDTIANGDNEKVIPYGRFETRACWIDNEDNLWMMGGGGSNAEGGGKYFNDLVYYSTQKNVWLWAGNDTIADMDAVYGSMGIADIDNKPSARNGALPFKDKNGNLWLYGGEKTNLALYLTNYYGDLWKYTMNNGIPPCDGNYEVEDYADNTKIIISPNPGYGMFVVESGAFIDQIKVIDILGNVVFDKEISSKQFSFELDKPGVYLCVFISGSKSLIKKIVVI